MFLLLLLIIAATSSSIKLLGATSFVGCLRVFMPAAASEASSRRESYFWISQCGPHQKRIDVTQGIFSEKILSDVIWHLRFKWRKIRNRTMASQPTVNAHSPSVCVAHISHCICHSERGSPRKKKVQLTKRRRLWGKIYNSILPSLPWQRDRLPSPTETWLSRRLGQFLRTRLLMAEPGSEVRRRSSHTVQAPVFESGRSHLCNPRQSRLVMWWLDITLCKPPGIWRDTHTLVGKNHEASLEAFRGAKRLPGLHYQAANSVLTFCLGLEIMRIQHQKVNLSKSLRVTHCAALSHKLLFIQISSRTSVEIPFHPDRSRTKTLNTGKWNFLTSSIWVCIGCSKERFTFRDL